MAYRVNFEFKCEWEEAINFSPGNTGTYGYLLSWSGCGGVSLNPDIVLPNPFTSEGQSQAVVFPDEYDDAGTVLKCVGVISDFKYSGKKHGPITITAYVSRKSAANLHGKFMSDDPPKTDLELSWYIISCEGAGAKWYEAAHVMGFSDARANINTEESRKSPPKTTTTQGAQVQEDAADDDDEEDAGGQLKVSVAHESVGIRGNGDDIDVRLYEFTFEIVPAPGQMNKLHFATGLGHKVVKQWGGPP
jgi:hypothetical protein